jgi:hypothetical protein
MNRHRLPPLILGVIILTGCSKKEETCAKLHQVFDEFADTISQIDKDQLNADKQAANQKISREIKGLTLRLVGIEITDDELRPIQSQLEKQLKKAQKMLTAMTALSNARSEIEKQISISEISFTEAKVALKNACNKTEQSGRARLRKEKDCNEINRILAALPEKELDYNKTKKAADGLSAIAVADNLSVIGITDRAVKQANARLIRVLRDRESLAKKTKDEHPTKKKTVVEQIAELAESTDALGNNLNIICKQK